MAKTRLLRPYGRYLMVKRDPMEQPGDHIVKANKLILSDSTLAKSKFGRVIARGGWLDERRLLTIGSRVVMTWRNGTPWRDGEHGMVEILHEDEILAVFI